MFVYSNFQFNPGKMMIYSADLKRCPWVRLEDSLSISYHDEEWGVPVHQDCKHFEFLILEGAQAGLSWHTILKRRKNYEQAFSHFDPKRIADYDEDQMAKLLMNEGIIRNKLKIESSIVNAKHFLNIQREFGSFDQYVWQFVDDKPIQNYWKSMREIPAETKESCALSQDLKKRGFKFVGPTIMYAYMQAVGLVNDHTIDCFRHTQILNISIY
jgi:DNA-3-methyladenine glycosylase I